MIGVILNPTAGGGRMHAHWPKLAQAIERRLGEFELLTTSREGEASEIARTLADRGARLVIAVGGDGTAGEVVDGLLDARAAGARIPELAILPYGTGADFARNLDLGANAFDAVEKLASGTTRSIDAGRVSYISDAGEARQRFFLNIASLGLSGPTGRAVNALKRRGKRQSRFVYLYQSLKELLRYRLKDVRIVLDGDSAIEAKIAVVAVANGRFFGGGMMIAPDAELDDGLFDVVVFRGASKLKMIADMNLVYSGAHKRHKLVTIKRARSVVVEPLDNATHDPVLIDIDGESPGRIPARFDILPAALTLRC
jgi:YegS/Rv2252/BmrU family lipid kinase